MGVLLPLGLRASRYDGREGTVGTVRMDRASREEEREQGTAVSRDGGQSQAGQRHELTGNRLWPHTG